MTVKHLPAVIVTDRACSGRDRKRLRLGTVSVSVVSLVALRD
jgi:hypothetical protein